MMTDADLTAVGVVKLGDRIILRSLCQNTQRKYISFNIICA